MSTHNRLIQTAAIAALTLATAGCARSFRTPEALVLGPYHTVMLDGKRVRPTQDNLLLDLLRGRVPSSRLDIRSMRPDREPLLIIDNASVSGAYDRLADMSVMDVKRVTTLRMADAWMRYGSPGYYGAIIVETMRGR